MKAFMIGLIIGTLFYSFQRMDRQDMKVCQLSHSFETCHTALNR